MFCSRIFIYFIHIVFLYIEKSNMRENNCCMEKTLNMWKKHLVHGVSMYYEEILYIDYMYYMRLILLFSENL